MKKCFVIIIVASALAISISIIGQQAQAQNTPQSINDPCSPVTHLRAEKTTAPEDTKTQNLENEYENQITARK